MKFLDKFAYSVFCLMVSATFALGAVFDHPVNDGSRKQLTAALEQMTSHGIVYGNFKQTKSIKKLNRDFVSTGNFMISSKYGISWNTLKPFASLMMVTQSGIFQQAGKGPVKKISSQENPVFAEFSRTIQAVFSGNCQELEKNFSVYFEKAGKNVVIGLVPREPAVRKVIESIVLEGSSSLDKMSISDGEGNPVVYELSDQKQMSESQMDSLISAEENVPVRIYKTLRDNP